MNDMNLPLKHGEKMRRSQDVLRPKVAGPRNDVKFAWKVQRDVAERGWTEEQVRV